MAGLKASPFSAGAISVIAVDVLTQIRTMREPDLPEVLRLERASYDYPWSEGVFRDCLRAGYACIVLCVDERIVAYGVFQFAAGEAHILNLCVESTQRRMGYACQLLQELFYAMEDRGADTVYLEVRASNQGAINLYTREGFNEVGVRKGYYRTRQVGKYRDGRRNNGKEDALIMARYADCPVALADK